VRGGWGQTGEGDANEARRAEGLKLLEQADDIAAKIDKDVNALKVRLSPACP
jgi:hypothetical protein